MKVNKYDDGIIIIDRGPISTLVYNQVLHLIDNKYDTSYAEKWFEQFLNIYKSDDTYNYYLNNPGIYNTSLCNNKNPFGSIENLKLTHAITIFNLNKYAKKYRVFDYDKTNLEELLNEIINSFMCTRWNNKLLCRCWNDCKDIYKLLEKYYPKKILIII